MIQNNRKDSYYSNCINDYSENVFASFSVCNLEEHNEEMATSGRHLTFTVALYFSRMHIEYYLQCLRKQGVCRSTESPTPAPRSPASPRERAANVIEVGVAQPVLLPSSSSSSCRRTRAAAVVIIIVARRPPRCDGVEVPRRRAQGVWARCPGGTGVATATTTSPPPWSKVCVRCILLRLPSPEHLARRYSRSHKSRRMVGEWARAS